jgi:radical SAM superfamily enzyme YgiQ (UPF0313 family)
MRTAKITLIYAGITESGFRNTGGNEGSWINHGLCLISAALKRAGFIVTLIDLRRLTGWAEFEKVVQDSDIDIAGITMMSVDYNPVMQCVDIIKRFKPDTKVIVGGPHASIAPQELLRNERIDHIFIGEAEISIIDFMRKFEEGQQQSKIIYGEKPNLDNLPFADRNLFSLQEEPFVPFLKGPFVTIIAGRGCAYNCSYCQPAERMIFGKHVRRRSVGHVIEELKYLRKQYHFKSMMIHDDCLTEDSEWVAGFCEEYKRNDFTQPFVCQSRPDLICKREDTIEALSEAGLALCIIGFESGSQRILNLLRRGYRLERNFEAAKICRKLGIRIWANYMLGLPTESKKEQKDTVEMIKKIKPYHCSPAYYTPHPGSSLFKYCNDNGLSLIKSHNDYRRNTYEPKIKGIDYGYLKKLLFESIAVGEDQSSLQGKVKSFIPNPVKRYMKRSFLSQLK